ncbi:dsDNA nuclease domain-containing protein [Fictibacillus phosphorivorans]|uniref:dsDNA nuclease domain-containing protein n=1 Tax=Fictibacillus phosphorivorans TaxID=1221500 RepID=UPI003CEC866F
MSNNVLLLFEKYKSNTDAVHTNRGFLYQYLKTLKTWICDAINNTENEIFCETEDDIKEVNADAKSLKFTQVKCYSSNLGMQDDEIEKTIYNFFILYNLYPDYNGQFHFETNTNIKRNDEILKNWYKDQENMCDDLLSKCKLRVQEILKGMTEKKQKSEIQKIEKRIAKIDPSMLEEIDSLNKQKDTVVKEFKPLFDRINQDDYLESFVKSIRWSFEQIEGEEAVRIIKQECIDSLEKYTVKYTYLLLTRLLSEIYYRSSNTEVDDRKLNKSLLDEIIKESEQEMSDKSDKFITESLNKITEKIDDLKGFVSDRFHSVHEKLDTLISDTPSYDFEKMIEMYLIRIESFLENNLTLPFQSELDNDLINNSHFNDFFKGSTWKTRIILHIREFARAYGENSMVREKGIIDKLLEFIDLDISYDENRTNMRKKVNSIIAELPDNRITKGFKPSLFQIYTLLNDRYNKVLMITGESGAGKTHLIKCILSSHSIEKELRSYSIRIPLTVSHIREKGFKEAVLFNLNYFLDCKFTSLSEINRYVINLERKGVSFRIIFIIDDLHILCNSNAKIYDYIKETIKSYTKNDWISWCISINELDQYLIMDNSGFLKEYCFSNNSENDALNLFVNMSTVNNKNKVCYKILNNHGIDTKVIDELPDSINLNNNIKMLIQNPLICYVYAITVIDNEKELHNICYFDFIKRYSKVKKNQMIQYSKRNLSSNEIDAQIDNEIDHVVSFLIDNKKLTYFERETNSLFQTIKHSYDELLSAHLASKRIIETKDLLEDRKDILVEFVFPLYWAFKILLHFRVKNDWSAFSLLRKSFFELKDELFIYELLYLDTDFENNFGMLTQEIADGLNSDNGKEQLFFVAIKTSVKCQGIIFQKLLENEELILNKKETFGLLYFLLHTNARIDNKCKVLGRNLERISEYELGVYLESLCKVMFNSLKELKKLKKCISEFIRTEDTRISETIGKIAANSFAKLVDGIPLEDVIKNHLINFLSDNLEKIIDSKNGKNNTFIDYFLRYLFRTLIENSTDNRFLLHEVLLSNNFYYLEGRDEKFKPIEHILRSNSAIAYGSYYKHLNHSKKKIFKKLYIDCITNLLESDLTRLRILAYHFISNTLIDPEDQNLSLEDEFIPLLKIIYEDKRLNNFNKARKWFYDKKLNPSSR